MSKKFYEELKNSGELREELKSNPNDVLKRHNISGFDGKKIFVHENTGTKMHYILFPQEKSADYPEMSESLKRVQQEAQDDPEFKFELLSNPREALIRLFGSIPEKMEIEIHEDTQTERHIVLPEFVDPYEELGDDELELVAGGKSTCVLIAGTP